MIHHKELIEKLMSEQDVYRMFDLADIREAIARGLGIPAAIVGETIREHFDCTLRELVNEHRVRKAGEILGDPACEDKKIIEIAYEVGYGNLRTFNFNFKELTGYTPTEYRAFYMNFRKYFGLAPADIQDAEFTNC